MQSEVMESIDLNSIPLSALNYSSRYMIGKFLNAEVNLLSKEGYARDYRGLAEQMNFMYYDIRNFQRSDEPTLKVLEAWEADSDATVGKLIKFLENMGRYDAIQDLQPRFEKDAKLYIQKKTLLQNSPLQVPEVTSCRREPSYLNDPYILTREDAYTGECTFYDAYLSYADEDSSFASHLRSCLESDGFKIFFRHRDMLGGLHFEYEKNMQIIKERCKRVLVILSPDFLKCPSCEVQAHFAAGLGFDERCRKIIPILWKPCEIPLILKFMSKIDFTKPDVKDWIWDKLKLSLRDVSTSVFISSDKRLIQDHGSLPSMESSTDTCNPEITFPSTTSCNFNAEAPTNACVSSEAVLSNDTQSDSVENNLKSSKQKNKLQNFLNKLQTKKTQKKHFFSSDDASSTSVSSSSNATSGFHSQSGIVFESVDVPTAACSQDNHV